MQHWPMNQRPQSSLLMLIHLPVHFHRMHSDRMLMSLLQLWLRILQINRNRFIYWFAFLKLTKFRFLYIPLGLWGGAFELEPAVVALSVWSADCENRGIRLAFKLGWIANSVDQKWIISLELVKKTKKKTKEKSNPVEQTCFSEVK